MESKKVVLLTGSNLGDKMKNLEQARALISKYLGDEQRRSQVLKTEAWPDASQAFYLNQLIEIESSLHPMQALRNIMTMERSMGRVRGERNAPRIIDIDLLEWEDCTMQNALLTLPHPALGTRQYLEDMYKNWNV